MRAMRVVSIVFSVVIVAGVVAIILYAGWKKNWPNQFETAFNSGGDISLDLSAGGYTIKGTAENQIRVEPDANETRHVRCQMLVAGSKAKVEVEGPSGNFHATIYVPQRSELHVDQTIGDMVVTNVEGDKNLDLGIGRLQVEVPADEPLPTFDGSVVLGSLCANNWHVQKGGFFRDFYSRSSGGYSLSAHVDIGDLETTEASPKVGDSHSQKSQDAGQDVSDQDSEDDSQ